MFDRVEKTSTDDRSQPWTVDIATADYSNLLLKLAANRNYRELEWLILLKSDSLEGVTSHIELSTKYPTGIALVREPIGTISDKQLLSTDHPLIESNNMLLRTLSTMRAIDWVLTKTGKVALQDDLQQKLFHLIEEIKQFQLNIAQGKTPFNQIESIEKRFNLFLKHTLIDASLAEGLRTQHDFEMMLTHYRNLASSLDPAKSIVTIQQYGNINHRESAHPITKKTAAQIKQLAVMSSLSTASENFHSTQVSAMQIANYYFHELIAKDDRRLPAGSRSTIGPTVKNGYVIHNELYTPSSTITEFWATRGGTLAYIGAGESSEQRDDFATANLQQLQEHIARVRHKKEVSAGVQLHLVVLLTNCPIESQSTMITHSYHAKERMNARQRTVYWTNVALNDLGLIYPLEISSLIKDPPSRCPDIGNKAKRLKKAAQIICTAAQYLAVTSYISCASGQDRTGTACEAATQQWLETNLHSYGITLNEIQQARALACHNAILAGLATPGSPGMKIQSITSKAFPRYMSDRFYRHSADTGADTNNATPLADDEDVLTQTYEEVIAASHGTLEDMICALTTWAEIALTYQGPSVNILDESITNYSGMLFKKPLPYDKTRDLLLLLREAIHSETREGMSSLLTKLTTFRTTYETAEDRVFEQMYTLFIDMQMEFPASDQRVSCRVS